MATPIRAAVWLAILRSLALAADSSAIHVNPLQIVHHRPPCGPFRDPQPVTIIGYSGDAMEPFISRDGKYLFFNDLNTAPATKLYWATSMDALTFQFQGEVGGVNTAMLDAVASMDLNGNFFFISTRSYTPNLSTVYTGAFAAGNVSGVAPAPGIVSPMPGLVDFDAEVSADGRSLYFTEGKFNGGSQPSTAQIIVATRGADGSFTRSAESATILGNINTNTLNYAADTSASQLELFFTRLDPDGPAIYAASRSGIGLPFAKPVKIAAITGFAEAPSISPDGRTLFYHRQENGHFAIYAVTRQNSEWCEPR